MLFRSQLDWYNGETLVAENSSWGQLDLDITPDDNNTFYLNVVGQSSSAPAWIIQNYPIFSSGIGTSNNQAVYFDITDLGLPSGSDLTSLNTLIRITPDPISEEPTGLLSIVPVDTIERRATGHNLPLTNVNEPSGHKAEGKADKPIQHKNVPKIGRAHV